MEFFSTRELFCSWSCSIYCYKDENFCLILPSSRLSWSISPTLDCRSRAVCWFLWLNWFIWFSVPSKSVAISLWCSKAWLSFSSYSLTISNYFRVKSSNWFWVELSWSISWSFYFNESIICALISLRFVNLTS